MFTPINHETGNSAGTHPQSLASERSVDRTGSLKGPSKWEAEVLKTWAANRKRSRSQRSKPALHEDVLAANNAGPSRGCQGEPLLSTALVKKTKHTSSSSVYNASFDTRNPATKAAQARIEIQPLTDMPLSLSNGFGSPRGTTSKKRNMLGKAQKRMSEPTNNPTKERKSYSIGASDLPSRRVAASSSTRYELSPETHRRLESFKYAALPALGQITRPGSSSNKEHRNALNGESPVTSSSLTKFDYIDTRPSALSSSVQGRKHDCAHVQEGVPTAKSPPEDEFCWSHDIDDGLLDQLDCALEDDDFEWDQNMDDALLDQLDQIEANAGYRVHGINRVADDNNFARINFGPDHRCQRSRAVKNDNSRNCGEIDMNGDIDDEDIFAFMANHQDLRCFDTQQENAKTLGGPFPTVGREARSLAALVYPSLAEIFDDEDFSFDTGDVDEIVQSPRATERFSPPSSLWYPFDNSSQMLGAHNSNLRTLPPPAEENPNSGNIGFTDDIRYEALVPMANMPSSGNPGEIIDQTGRIADRTLAVTDDNPYATAKSCIGGQVMEPTHVIAQPLTTDSSDESMEKRKLRVRIPKPPTTTSPLIPVKSKLAPHLLEFDTTGNPKPFVRPPFPKQAQDRSPIVGLSSKAFLRTCFRVGEALRAGSHAGRWGQDAIIELYARVVFSSRERWKQHFQFADLFHDRPPFLTGTYEIFHGVELWERDSARFLTEDGKNKICRCIGRMKRAGATWKLVVLNIWEATWDDVSWVKGIVCA
jgi:hypothetical protein